MSRSSIPCAAALLVAAALACLLGAPGAGASHCDPIFEDELLAWTPMGQQVWLLLDERAGDLEAATGVTPTIGTLDSLLDALEGTGCMGVRFEGCSAAPPVAERLAGLGLPTAQSVPPAVEGSGFAVRYVP
jgi:hypothetical protein